jgi:hypothetical protein
MLAQGLAEELREIEGKRQQEQKLAQPAEAAGQGTSSAQDQDEDADMDDVAFRLPPTGDSSEPTVVKASQVQGGAKRETIRSIMSATRQHIAAQIHLIPQDPDPPYAIGGLSAALAATAGRKLRGEPQPDNPTKSKYIGIFYDLKVAGEANHRPMLRAPPLRAEQLRRLVDLARSRFGAEVADDEIPKGDLYFMFDGGRPGNTNELLKPFQSMTKTVKTFHLWKDEASLTNRYKRNKGTIGSFRQTEQMLVISATPPAMQPVGLQHWKGIHGWNVDGAHRPAGPERVLAGNLG